jgi:hypothetical protein
MPNYVKYINSECPDQIGGVSTAQATNHLFKDYDSSGANLLSESQSRISAIK